MRLDCNVSFCGRRFIRNLLFQQVAIFLYLVLSHCNDKQLPYIAGPIRAGAGAVLAHGLASGMLSGIVSRLFLMALLYPLDTLRVRVQVTLLT